jgi:carbonic anhydrase/acetyltransferase-like protein (isoleucine patch superfamily)
MNLYDKAPVIPQNAFVAPSAAVVGDVNVGSRSSIWHGCVLRGEIHVLVKRFSMCYFFKGISSAILL